MPLQRRIARITLDFGITFASIESRFPYEDLIAILKAQSVNANAILRSALTVSITLQ
jgi:hypothetical protein